MNSSQRALSDEEDEDSSQNLRRIDPVIATCGIAGLSVFE